MSHRIFIGIRPPGAIRNEFLDIMEGVEGARWQDDAQLHLTLRFLGEVETPAANDLAAALARISADPFELRVAGVGAFERNGRTHAIWARVSPSAELENLRQKVERACELAGLGRETRHFTPHVTLARLNSGSGTIAPWLAAHAGYRTAKWPVAEFILYESHLGSGGSYYEQVTSFRLR